MVSTVERIARENLRHPPPRARKSRLSAEHLYTLLWCWSNFWTNARIARALPCGLSTVRHWKDRISDDSGILFNEIDLFFLVTDKGKRRFECGLCGVVKISRIAGQRHFLSHFLPGIIARDCDLTRDTSNLGRVL